MIIIKLPKEEKLEIIRSVQGYFAEERSEELGELGAEQLVDFMLQELGPYIYNKAIADARNTVNGKMGQLEDELYALERPTQRQKR